MKTEKQSKKTKLLKEAYMYCIEKEKSLEFTIQYMQDFANVSFDKVINYLEKNHFKTK